MLLASCVGALGRLWDCGSLVLSVMRALVDSYRMACVFCAGIF